MPRVASMSSKVVTVKENAKLAATKARALLSKRDTSSDDVDVGETSLRVYYGGTGAAVPFVWESQPGTPKHPMFGNQDDELNILPPLTPPPSYLSSSSFGFGKSNSKRSRKPRFFSSIFSRNKSSSNVTPTSSSLSSAFDSGPLSWSTSSSSSSSVSSPRQSHKKHVSSHRRSNSLGFSTLKFPLYDDAEEEDSLGSPTSSKLKCFGLNKEGSNSLRNFKKTITSSIKLAP